jgi:hypothetical protein
MGETLLLSCCRATLVWVLDHLGVMRYSRALLHLLTIYVQRGGASEFDIQCHCYEQQFLAALLQNFHSPPKRAGVVLGEQS